MDYSLSFKIKIRNFLLWLKFEHKILEPNLLRLESYTKLSPQVKELRMTELCHATSWLIIFNFEKWTICYQFKKLWQYVFNIFWLINSNLFTLVSTLTITNYSILYQKHQSTLICLSTTLNSTSFSVGKGGRIPLRCLPWVCD